MAANSNVDFEARTNLPLQLVPVAFLDTEKQLAIRDIRNEASVRAAMFTNHVIQVNEHLQWISGLKHDLHRLAFAIVGLGHGPVGLVQLEDIARAHKRADWGIYVTDVARGNGVGTATACNFLDFAFEDFGLEKLNAQVIEGNEASIRFHLKLGFENEGRRRSNIEREGRRLDAILLGLTKTDWISKRAEIRAAHSASLARFPIKIDWEQEKRTESPIDRIEEARSRNNLNWMSILRIALERSPETAKQIVAEIRKLDQEISGLTQEIISGTEN